MTLLADLEEFVSDHRPHGTLTSAATEPAWSGYLLTVACPCGVVFESEEENLTPVPVWGKDRPSCYQHTRGCVRSCDSVRVDICGYVDKM